MGGRAIPPDDDYGNYYADPPRHTVEVATLVDKNAAVAQVTWYRYDGTVLVKHTATGSSKREPGDVFDLDLGEQFALARALAKLSAVLKHEANQEVTRRCHG